MIKDYFIISYNNRNAIKKIIFCSLWFYICGYGCGFGSWYTYMKNIAVKFKFFITTEFYIRVFCFTNIYLLIVWNYNSDWFFVVHTNRYMWTVDKCIKRCLVKSRFGLIFLLMLTSCHNDLIISVRWHISIVINLYLIQKNLSW